METLLIQNKSLKPREWAFDAALACAVFAFACAQVLLTSFAIVVSDEMFRTMVGYVTTVPPLEVFLALALITLPLTLRRISPWLVFIFVLLTFLGVQDAFRGFAITIAGPAVALFTIASLRRQAEGIVALVIAVASLLVSNPVASEIMAGFFRMQNMTFLVAALLAGLAVRAHREYLAETERRAADAERTREEEAVRRVAEERVRIARELHDITAHSLTAVSIQAAAAERLVDRNPEAAKEAIATVRSTAKGALEEIRSMIGVLRDDDAAEKAPTQGTERMGDLVGYLQEAGLRVSFDDAAYDRRGVPTYMDVALFGIAREAVTNIVRHARASQAWLRLAQADGSVSLTVEDDGVGMPESLGDGHGVKGMGERVSLLGGTFQIWRRAGGGTVVQADIPLANGRSGRNGANGQRARDERAAIGDDHERSGV